MAIQAKFDMDDRVYSDAYIRIAKIHTHQVDYEKFEERDADDGIVEQLTWVKREESRATVFIWADKIARDNRAQPLKWFAIDFEFKHDSDQNIYSQAYQCLKESDRFEGVIDV